jgi:hypothetical protein
VGAVLIHRPKFLHQSFTARICSKVVKLALTALHQRLFRRSIDRGAVRFFEGLSDVMLLRVSEQIRECLDHAAEAAEKAAREADPERKTALLDMERRWMLLVESFRLAEQVERFIEDGKTHRSVAALSVVRFLPRGVFDDEATHAMGEAFDSALAVLGEKFQPNVIHEVIARRIITAARKGERNPNRLRDTAIAAIKRSISKAE